MRYHVYITPRLSRLEYDEEVEVSDWVPQNGIGEIRVAIDDSDFDIGVFAFDNVNIKFDNYTGRFSLPQDSRSMFTYSRDLARVRVELEDDDGEFTTMFRGLINEEGVELDAESSVLTCAVLSLGSVMRNTVVPTGAIDDGETTLEAILAIVDRRPINDVCTVDGDNINPVLTIDVDEADDLIGAETKDSLQQLMLATNSIFVVDVDGNVIVRSREENPIDPIYFYGPGDLRNRVNCVITDFNSGLHRMFSRIVVNDEIAMDETVGQLYGERQKELTFGFVTNALNSMIIAENILDEFKSPKRELELLVATSVVKDTVVLDPVRVHYPLMLRPGHPGADLPIVGVTKIGSTTETLPYISGALKIEDRVKFKVIAIEHDPTNLTSKLKLRETGTEIFDGVE